MSSRGSHPFFSAHAQPAQGHSQVQISDISCGANNLLILTDGGKIFTLDENTFSQLGNRELSSEKQEGSPLLNQVNDFEKCILLSIFDTI